MKTGQGTLHFSVKLCVLLALCWIPWCTDWEARKKCQSKALCHLCLSKAAWSLDSGNTALFLLILLQPWSCSAAQQSLAGSSVCLCLHTATGTTACGATQASVSAQTSHLLCVHRTDLIREAAKLSPSCVQLNSCDPAWPGPTCSGLGLLLQFQCCALPFTQGKSPARCSSCMLETDVQQ